MTLLAGLPFSVDPAHQPAERLALLAGHLVPALGHAAAALLEIAGHEVRVLLPVFFDHQQ